MKLKRIAPCRECPFVAKSTPGWLGAWEDADHILGQALSETGLPCHMQKLGEVTMETLTTKHVCVGSLQMANASCKLFKNQDLHQQQVRVGKNPEVMTQWGFKQHHEMGAL